jgi:putative ABC transport system permease protein
MPAVLRQALRTLRRSPGFTLAALATFALGVGANATVFGVVNAVLLRAYPFAEPGRLVALYERDLRGGNDRFVLSPANFRDWQGEARTLSAMAAVGRGAFTMRAPDTGEPTRVAGSRVTWTLPRVLGVAPALGRGFSPADDRPGAPGVAIISHRLWRTRFGGDPAAVGRAVDLNGAPVTVVGVLPAAVRYPSGDTDVWVPFAMSDSAWTAQRGNHSLDAVGRLAPGATLAQARAELSAVAARIARAYPDEQANFGASVFPFHEAMTGGARPALYVLLGAVSFVLLLACANVANLTLARAAARQRESALRAAVGARRWHLVRQPLAESVLVGLGGGALGLALAGWACAALPALVPANIPRLDEAGVDWRVAGFTLALALAAGALAGAAPALHAARADLHGLLKTGGKGSTGGAARARTRDALFVAEVAFALLLLAGAGLALTSLGRLLAVAPGFAPERVLTAEVALPRARYASDTAQGQFWEALTARLAAAPGAAGAGVVSLVPLGGGMAMLGYEIVGRPPARPNEGPVAVTYYASEGYFRALGVPLRRGRAFAASDRRGAPPVAVVSERLAREHFRGEEPIGRRVRPFGDDGPAFEIVGVVGDVKHTSLADEARPSLYLPMAQAPVNRAAVVLRASGEPASLAGALRRAVAELDPALAVASVRPMRGVIAEATARPRFSAVLLAAFAGCAVLLALVGVYGVVANGVAQRRGEFGVRMALGARPGDVARHVLRGALGRAAAGIAVGLAGAAALTRLMAAQLYATSPLDPAVLGGVSAAVALVVAAASWLPARRATRVNPLQALRAE